MDYSKVFYQYLKTIPPFESIISVKTGKKVNFRYTNCIEGFNLPLALDSGDGLKSSSLNEQHGNYCRPELHYSIRNSLRKMYYIKVNG